MPASHLTRGGSFAVAVAILIGGTLIPVFGAGINTKVAGNQWHTLGLRAEGDASTISFDGKTLFTAHDNTFANSGRVALWTKADSITHFDTLRIMPLD